MSRRLREPLVRALEVDEGERVRGRRAARPQGPVGHRRACTGFAELRDAPWTPGHPAAPRSPTSDEEPDVMAAMRKGDILVHHPYDSFATSVERLVEQAVADPKVLAIKQTVYRTSDDSPLVPALIRAAERGKQAVCLVELKARFDERANIGWARALEEAGVHVVYGLPGAQDAREVHPDRAPRGRRRAPLRARRHRQLPPEDGAPLHRLRPAHLRRRRSAPTSPTCSTSSPASRARGAFRRVLVAPAHMRDGHPRRDRAHDRRQARRAGSARIAMKMNSLVDKRCIQALYRASQAGVPVDLNIRGICCLRPGVPGVSENIRVHLDRRPLPRALAHLRVRARRRADDLHRLGRPDAAQPRHARRAARAGARRGAARRAARHARALHGRQHERLGRSAADGDVDAPRRRRRRARATCSAS